MRSWRHGPGDAIVVCVSAAGYQRQCRVARGALRVRAPGVRTKLGNFELQPVGIDHQCQANEGLRELHLLPHGGGIPPSHDMNLRQD
jgi:hypothetical protein